MELGAHWSDKAVHPALTTTYLVVMKNWGLGGAKKETEGKEPGKRVKIR